jgi:hypothetical protein
MDAKLNNTHPEDNEVAKPIFKLNKFS